MLSKAIVGGGCFWCVEACLQRLKGVQKVQSGYAGGKSLNPTYQQVCSGMSGHAEVVRVHYNPQIIPYRDLIYIFMNVHDPTTLNRQGNDTGTQYRSIILYETQEEKDQVNKVFEELNEKYDNKIVTIVQKAGDFYMAQENHQNFYNENTSNGYCKAMIKPKIGKLKDMYSKYLDKAKL